MSVPSNYEPQAVSSKSRPPPAAPKYLKHQVYEEPHAFRRLDEHAIMVARYPHKDFRELMWDLVDCTQFNELEKARIIFRWMTSKNMYILQFDHEEPGSPEEILTSFRRRKGTFAKIYELMCNYAGMHCVTINGFAKGVEYRPGKNFSGQPYNHSWNAVNINGSYQLVDVHWATRYLSSEKNLPENLVYEYDDFYFMMEPQQAIYSHFPEHKEWQLLPKPITVGQFEDLPLTKSQFFKCFMDFMENNHGVVKCKHGSLQMTLCFWKPCCFTYKLALCDTLEEEYKGTDLKSYVLQEMYGNTVNFLIRAPVKANYYFTIYAQHVPDKPTVETTYRAACEYKIIFDRAADKATAYPKCSDTNWGPGVVASQYGLVPTVKDAVITAPNGHAELGFIKHNPDVSLLGKLRRPGMQEQELDKCVKETDKDNEVSFEIDLPKKGEYGLEIYANKPEDGSTYTHMCQYMLSYPEKPGKGDFKDSYDPSIFVKKPEDAKMIKPYGEYKPGTHMLSEKKKGPATAPKPKKGAKPGEENLDELPPPPPDFLATPVQESSHQYRPRSDDPYQYPSLAGQAAGSGPRDLDRWGRYPGDQAYGLDPNERDPWNRVPGDPNWGRVPTERDQWGRAPNDPAWGRDPNVKDNWGRGPNDPMFGRNPNERDQWGRAPGDPDYGKRPTQRDRWGRAPNDPVWGWNPNEPDAWGRRPGDPAWGRNPNERDQWGRKPGEPGYGRNPNEGDQWGRAPSDPMYGRPPSQYAPAERDHWGRLPGDPDYGKRPTKRDRWGRDPNDPLWGWNPNEPDACGRKPGDPQWGHDQLGRAPENPMYGRDPWGRLPGDPDYGKRPTQRDRWGRDPNDPLWGWNPNEPDACGRKPGDPQWGHDQFNRAPGHPVYGRDPWGRLPGDPDYGKRPTQRDRWGRDPNDPVWGWNPKELDACGRKPGDPQWGHDQWNRAPGDPVYDRDLWGRFPGDPDYGKRPTQRDRWGRDPKDPVWGWNPKEPDSCGRKPGDPKWGHDQWNRAPDDPMYGRDPWGRFPGDSEYGQRPTQRDRWGRDPNDPLWGWNPNEPDACGRKPGDPKWGYDQWNRAPTDPLYSLRPPSQYGRDEPYARGPESARLSQAAYEPVSAQDAYGQQAGPPRKPGEKVVSTANWTQGKVEAAAPQAFAPQRVTVFQSQPKPTPEYSETIPADVQAENVQRFKDVDKHAVEVSRLEHRNFRDLVWALIYCRQINDEMEKARAIFLWLCTKDLHKMNFQNVEKDSPEEILMGLKTGKTTYAQIYEILCSYAGLHCVIITGYAKGADYRPGMKFEGRQGQHSWNAVLIDGIWRLVDCHWAARRLIASNIASGKQATVENVRYELDLYYFCPSPAQLIYTHFPEERDWQLLRRSITKEDFEQLAPVKSAFFKFGLELMSHRQAVINCNGATDVHLSFPAYRENDLAFTFSIAFEDGNEEYHGTKLSRYGMQETVGNNAVFRLRFPESGSYKLLIYAKEVDPENKDAVYGAVCEYKVVANIPRGKELEPYPPCHQTTWGPAEASNKYGLIPYQKSSIIQAQDGSCEIKFKSTKNLRFMGKLKNNKYPDEELEKFIMHRTLDQIAVFEITLPEKGEYGCEIYANDPEKEGNTLFHVWQYLIVSETAGEQRGISLPPGYLGPQPKFASLGLKCVSHQDPYVKLNAGQVEIKMSTTQPLRVTSQLIYASNGANDDVSSYILQQMEGNKLTFVCKFERPGCYKLQLFALPYTDSSESLPGVYNYVIETTGEARDKCPFPKQFAQWKEGCYLYNPQEGHLTPALGRDHINFRMEVSSASAVAVVVGEDWTHLDQHGNVFEANVPFGQHWGQENKVSICANYGSAKASYSTLLEYTM